MAEGNQAEGSTPELAKDSPPLQDSPPASTTPDADADGRVRKARTTIILREVDPTATEEQILGLFTKTEFKVISTRIDLNNSWFVHMETEEMAKQAILHLNQQTLCDKPVKARIKSEGTLRTTAPAWQPTPQVAQAMFMNPSFPVQGAFAAPIAAPGPVNSPPYNTWANAKPASINRPPQEGAFKRQSPSGGDSLVTPTGAQTVMPSGDDVDAAGQSHQASRNQRRAQAGGNQSRGQGSDRKGGRRQGDGRSAPKPAASFQPQDFPSLSGEMTASQASVSGAVPIQEAPANSWAARAKTAAAEAAPPTKKKETSVPQSSQSPVEEATKQPKTKSEVQHQNQLFEQPKVSVETVNEVKPPSVAATTQKSPEASQTTAAEAAEMRRRGWETAPRKEAVTVTSPQMPVAPPAVEKEQVQKEAQSEKNRETGSSKQKQSGGGKRAGGASREKDANGHAAVEPSPIVPLPWGTKSFAQVIKEQPIAPPPTQEPAPSSALPALRNNENWGDVEDDETAGNPSKKTEGGSARSAGAARQQGSSTNLEKLRPSSESSNDWRRDAAARRKVEEQSRSPGARRPNGSSS